MSERVLILLTEPDEEAGLSSIARNLAGPRGFVAVLRTEPEITPAGNLRGDRVYQVSSAGFDPARGDHLATAVVRAVHAFDASVIISGPTKLEREALARAGATLGGPSLTGVRSLRAVSDGVEVSRDLLSGNAISVERTSSRPMFLSLSEFPPAPPSDSAPATPAEVVPLSVDLPQYPFRRVSLHPKPAGTLHLETADRIVSVGRGLQRKEDLALIDELATVLGAAVGCTRPIAAESGWLSDDHWVGLTGHRVRPTLYLAIGISGAAQHLVGMRDSKIVVAINLDANAPIFQQADYQVVGDLYAIVPEITRQWTARTTGTS
jgi:electron transfer flavoprotein alpha subunit